MIKNLTLALILMSSTTFAAPPGTPPAPNFGGLLSQEASGDVGAPGKRGVYEGGDAPLGDPGISGPSNIKKNPPNLRPGGISEPFRVQHKDPEDLARKLLTDELDSLQQSLETIRRGKDQIQNSYDSPDVNMHAKPQLMEALRTAEEQEASMLRKIEEIKRLLSKNNMSAQDLVRENNGPSATGGMYQGPDAAEMVQPPADRPKAPELSREEKADQIREERKKAFRDKIAAIEASKLRKQPQTP